MVSRTGRLGWNLALPAFACAVAVPSGYVCYTTDRFWLSVLAFILPTVACNCFAGPADAMLYSMTLPDMRGATSSIASIIGGAPPRNSNSAHQLMQNN